MSENAARNAIGQCIYRLIYASGVRGISSKQCQRLIDRYLPVFTCVLEHDPGAWENERDYVLGTVVEEMGRRARQIMDENGHNILRDETLDRVLLEVETKICPVSIDRENEGRVTVTGKWCSFVNPLPENFEFVDSR